MESFTLNFLKHIQQKLFLYMNSFQVGKQMKSIYESSFNNFIIINVPPKSKIFVLIFIFHINW